MLYMRFASPQPNTWTASTSEPIANVRLHADGHCSATITTDRALSREEMSCLSAFMRERERAN